MPRNHLRTRSCASAASPSLRTQTAKYVGGYLVGVIADIDPPPVAVLTKLRDGLRDFFVQVGAASPRGTRHLPRVRPVLQMCAPCGPGRGLLRSQSVDGGKYSSTIRMGRLHLDYAEGPQFSYHSQQLSAFFRSLGGSFGQRHPLKFSITRQNMLRQVASFNHRLPQSYPIDDSRNPRGWPSCMSQLDGDQQVEVSLHLIAGQEPPAVQDLLQPCQIPLVTYRTFGRFGTTDQEVRSRCGSSSSKSGLAPLSWIYPVRDA